MALNQGKPIDLLFLGTADFYWAELKAVSIQVSQGMVVNDELNNVRIGKEAGLYRTTGYNNICFGNQAAKYLTKGFENIAMGTDSMLNASGLNVSYNVSVGNSAMQNTHNAQRCVALGYYAGNGIEDALDCVCLGTYSGQSLKDAQRSISIGNYSGQFLRGDDTVTIGTNAGRGGAGPGTYGSSNCVYIGNSCGYNGGGSFNTAVGFECGYNMLSGANFNSLYGYKCGRAITTADQMVCIGYESGYSLTSGGANSGRNVIVGYRSGYYFNGDDSVMMGTNAGSGSVSYTGINCVFIGKDAATLNVPSATVIQNNVAIGTSALERFTNSAECVAIGTNSGKYSGGTTNCIMIGTNSGTNLLGVDSTIAIGNGAMQYTRAPNTVVIGKNAGRGLFNYTFDYDTPGLTHQGASVLIGYECAPLGGGWGCTIIGYNAGFALESILPSQFNTFVGHQAGFRMSDGERNVYVGPTSGDLLHGNYNIAFGYHALQARNVLQYEQNTIDTTIAIGYEACGELVDATFDVIGIGNRAGWAGVYGSPDAQNNTRLFGGVYIGSYAGHAVGAEGAGDAEHVCIGYNAGKSAGPNGQLSGTPWAGNGAVFIGTMSGTKLSGRHVDYTTAVGGHSLMELSTGARNTALGYASGATLTTGSNCVCLGYAADVSSSASVNRIAIGSGCINGVDNSCVIGTIAMLNNYYIYDADGVWQNASDRRLKENIQEVDLGLDFIRSLKVSTFQMKADKTHTIQRGLIADEVLESVEASGYPVGRIVQTFGDEQKTKTLSMGQIYNIHLGATQELADRVEYLEAVNADLSARLAQLEAYFSL